MLPSPSFNITNAYVDTTTVSTANTGNLNTTDISSTEFLNQPTPSITTSIVDQFPSNNTNTDAWCGIDSSNIIPHRFRHRANLIQFADDTDEVPDHYKDIKGRHNEDKWYSAFKDELESLSKHGNGSFRIFPQTRKLFLLYVYFVLKEIPLQSTILARGFSRLEGVDYMETYAPSYILS